MMKDWESIKSLMTLKMTHENPARMFKKPYYFNFIPIETNCHNIWMKSKYSFAMVAMFFNWAIGRN
jgi:hypothetical protein